MEHLVKPEEKEKIFLFFQKKKRQFPYFLSQSRYCWSRGDLKSHFL